MQLGSKFSSVVVSKASLQVCAHYTIINVSNVIVEYVETTLIHYCLPYITGMDWLEYTPSLLTIQDNCFTKQLNATYMQMQLYNLFPAMCRRKLHLQPKEDKNQSMLPQIN